MNILENAAGWILPLITAFAGCCMLFGKQDYFSAFLSGAKDGLQTCLHLLPILTLLSAGISMLNASGAVDVLSRTFAPIFRSLGVPADLLPLLLVRPFSGSASTGAFSALLEKLGVDSFPALCAAIIFGSSDTLVYIITVYFSSVGVRKTRWAFPCAVAVMLFCVFFSCFVCRLWFGN